MRKLTWKVKGTKEVYECSIRILEEQKLIFWIDCTCQDFMHRRIVRVGEFADARYHAEPCKHLKPVIERLENMGYKLKRPKEMTGEDKLTDRLRKQLMERSGCKCENEGCEKTSPLQIHRKTRGNNGGKYNIDNCVVLCIDCHKARHSGEFR